MVKVSRQQSEVSRHKIIDAAFLLFMDQGYHATSMRQIVEHAGLTMGGIYNHFASKEDIWVAVLLDKHPFQQILPALQQSQGETIAELIRDAAQRMVVELGRRAEVVNLMMIEVVEFKGSHMNKIFETFGPGFIQFAMLITQKTGKLRDLPAPTVARAFGGLFFSYYMTNWMISVDQRAMFGEDGLSDFVEIYLHGILAE